MRYEIQKWGITNPTPERAVFTVVSSHECPPLLPPPHSCTFFYIPQASLASCHTTLSMHLDIIINQVSPTLTGCTPGCLSRLIKRMAMSMWYVAYGGHSFTKHSTNSMKIYRRSALATSKQGNHCCILIESVTFSPATLDSFRPTSMNVSFVRSTRI